VRALMLAACAALWLQPANANEVVRLRAPFYGCATKGDIVEIARLITKAPRQARVETVRAYADKHCVALNRIVTTIAASDSGYVCLRRARAPCLWTLRDLIEKTGVDDGVF
jgi:hypothetical protein